MVLTECFVSIAFNRSLLRYGGDIAVGTMTIFSTIMQIATLPLQGFSQGAQPITSYNYGVGKLDRVSNNVKLLIKTSLCYACFLWFIILVVLKTLIGIFTSDASLIDYGTNL